MITKKKYRPPRMWRIVGWHISEVATYDPLSSDSELLKQARKDCKMFIVAGGE